MLFSLESYNIMDIMKRVEQAKEIGRVVGKRTQEGARATARVIREDILPFIRSETANHLHEAGHGRGFIGVELGNLASLLDADYAGPDHRGPEMFYKDYVSAIKKHPLTGKIHMQLSEGRSADVYTLSKAADEGNEGGHKFFLRVEEIMDSAGTLTEVIVRDRTIDNYRSKADKSVYDLPFAIDVRLQLKKGILKSEYLGISLGVKYVNNYMKLPITPNEKHPRVGELPLRMTGLLSQESLIQLSFVSVNIVQDHIEWAMQKL